MSFLKRVIKKIISKSGYILVKANPDKDQSFYCRALSGLSTYNISINSDMTVSCNCNDSNKQGVIGNLKEKSLKEIFCGERANKIRSELSAGKIPMDICNGCSELEIAPHSVSNYYIKNYQVPKRGLMIENCSLCNYSCIYCNRKEITSNRKSQIISKKDIEKIAMELKENNIKFIVLFKLGEPFMDSEIYEKMKIIKRINPDIIIHTSTNGMMINNIEKIKAALLFDEIHFSIDGVNSEIQNKYQRGANFDTIMENFKKLKLERGNADKPVLVWKYVVFSWNDSEDYIVELFNKAVENGFDKVQLTLGGTGFNVGGRSVRYYSSDFIPLTIKHKLEFYEKNHGMVFDIRKKNGT